MSKKKTKKEQQKADALAWLRMQGDKAFKNSNKKEVDIIAFLIRETMLPDYGAYLEKIRKIIVVTGNLDVSQYMGIVPPNKTKLINQKANK